MTLKYDFIYADGPDNTIIKGINFHSDYDVNTNFVQINSTTAPDATTLGNGSVINITYNGGLVLPPTFEFKLDLSTTNITSIGISAFEDIKYLSEITFSTGTITTIGNRAFYRSGLEKVNLTTDISNYDVGVVGSEIGLFEDCVQLSSINFGTITEIPSFTFKGCINLATITIPKTITTIGDNTFQSAQFSGLIFGERTNTDSPLVIGNYAFNNAEVPQLNLPIFLTSVGDYAFDGCIGFATLILPKFNSYYVGLVETVGSPCQFGINAFANNNLLYDLIIDGNITTTSGTDQQTSENMFMNCVSLKQITLYHNIVRIENSSFEGCSKLDQLMFAELKKNEQGIVIETQSFLVIGERAFYGCAFQYLMLKDFMTGAELSSFGNCQLLKQVIIDARDPILDMSEIFIGRTEPMQIIFGYKTTLDEVTLTKDLGVVGDSVYVFTNVQKTRIDLLLQQETWNNQDKKPTVYLKQYHSRKFINHKSIYDSENDPHYVMYTLKSSENRFDDSTFYFKCPSKTSSVVVMQKNDDENLYNCVKIFSSTAVVEGRTIQKFFKKSTIWYIQTTNGIQIPITDVTPDYVLQNNFICESPYDAPTQLILNGANLSTCDMFDLHNLTTNNKVAIYELKRVILTSNKDNETTQLKIRILTGSPVFEINKMDYDSFILTNYVYNGVSEVLTSANPSLIINNLIKDRSSNWSIEAPLIYINTLWFDYIVFQGQKIDETVLTKVECTADDFLVRFTTIDNQTINFQLIQNKNEQLIDTINSAPINSVYYSSGWSSPQ